jgi:hypothetical protein
VTIILALQVGRDFAMRTTKATAPMGRMYSKTMCAWCREHGFGDMKASIRSWALDLHENLAAITAWRASLPAKLQRRLRHPHAIVTRWRVSVAGREREHDLVKTARTAWKRFVMCVEALPASEALPLWQMAQNECAAHLVSQ